MDYSVVASFEFKYVLPFNSFICTLLIMSGASLAQALAKAFYIDSIPIFRLAYSVPLNVTYQILKSVLINLKSFNLFTSHLCV